MTTKMELKFCPICKLKRPKSEFKSRRAECIDCNGGNRVLKQREAREWQLAKYSLSFDDYVQWKEQQEYRCAICGIHEDDLTKSLAVDHCHESLEVRGLLCHMCNIGIGNFRDDPERLEAAARYLEWGGVQHGHLFASEESR